MKNWLQRPEVLRWILKYKRVLVLFLWILQIKKKLFIPICVNSLFFTLIKKIRDDGLTDKIKNFYSKVGEQKLKIVIYSWSGLLKFQILIFHYLPCSSLRYICLIWLMFPGVLKTFQKLSKLFEVIKIYRRLSKFSPSWFKVFGFLSFFLRAFGRVIISWNFK